MNREEMIDKLIELSPLVISVTETMDMGYEITAIVPEGLILPTPGMLLSSTGGHWPPPEWNDLNEERLNSMLEEFFQDFDFDVIPWDQLNDEEVADLLEGATS
jgi:hypothetical protein